MSGKEGLSAAPSPEGQAVPLLQGVPPSGTQSLLTFML